MAFMVAALTKQSSSLTPDTQQLMMMMMMMLLPCQVLIAAIPMASGDGVAASDQRAHLLLCNDGAAMHQAHSKMQYEEDAI
jgi:hypothetical protein